MKKILNKLIELSKQAASLGEVPVSAMVVQWDTIVSSSFNQKEWAQTPVAHAELLALDTAAKALNDWRLSGCELICTMEPCSMCAGTLLQTRIKRVYYLIRDEKFGACGSVQHLHQQNGLNHSFEAICIEDLHPEIAHQYRSLVQGFFQDLRMKNKQ